MDMSKVVSSPVHSIEMQEVIDKLKKAHPDYGVLIECLLENEKDCYTKKGRLNKSSTCRKLGWKNKRLEDALKSMRGNLKSEFNLEDEE